ncbi:hypothetical protein PHISCL_05256 [Aspergillus sclerotialis]|uniref:Uncharacterized protein n=1 Tax=Aspergillus sclerotialis TaxID=2070753 RepID=A0A3A2ZWM4_9EURO|nr:hypothetical protein PHISCL_05256 [Aspergillus sclerotialis]
MSSFPSTYERLKAHLAKVLDDPASPLDLRLIDMTRVELTEDTDPVVPATLLTQVSQILPVFQDDPTPLTELCIEATAYSTFTDIRSIDPPINLLAGLEAPSPPINLLAVSLLGKASKTPSDAAIVAGDSELATSLVKLWLSTPSPRVAQSALDVICQLLEVDLGRRSPDGEYSSGYDERVGQGLMWRRMFTDKRVYGLLFSICSLADDGPESLSRRDTTVAQGRLMNLLVKAGTLRWCMISRSQIKEIESKYDSTSLLHFAACKMVDKKDILMHMTLLDFFQDLLAIDAPGLMARTYIQSQFTFSSPALDFLISTQLHATVLDDYLHGSESENLDFPYLKGHFTAYVARYAELYPNHFLQNPQSMLDSILSSIRSTLSISHEQYAVDLSLADQLMVLSSLPRIMLVEASTRQLNPMQLVPTKPTSKAALGALAKIFHGPVMPEAADSMQPFSSGQTPTDWSKEAAAARILYYTYIQAHPDMWKDITHSAEVLALPDTAVVSISFVKDIITANWNLATDELLSSPAGSRFKLPSEEEIQQKFTSPSVQVAPSGTWAVLTQPALLTVIPYLFKPPRTYGDFGGGAVGSSSIVWKVAIARFDALVALDNRIHDVNDADNEDLEQIRSALTRLVNQGPLGDIDRTASSVGTAGM